MSALVEIKGLHKTFMHMGHELHVLKGIDLEIHEGQVLSIVGPSGAGKSTLLHCIGTLDLPTKGRINLDGSELTTLNESKLAAVRNRAIGFVFQFHHLLPEFTAVENIMMPGLIQGRARKEMKERALSLLAEVGLADRATHRPGELSGGEQQRVAVARALVLSPKLILADEPTGNLDTSTGDSIHELFFDINKKHGTTIVVVTHNPAFAESMPRVVRMRDGKVEQDDIKDPTFAANAKSVASANAKSAAAAAAEQDEPAGPVGAESESDSSPDSAADALDAEQ